MLDWRLFGTALFIGSTCCLFAACGEEDSTPYVESQPDGGTTEDTGTAGDVASGDVASEDAASGDAASGDSATGDTGTADHTGDTAEEDVAQGLPSLDELHEGWNIMRPGGETICSRGTEYLFAVRPGTVNKVVVDFMGGGACWNDWTCSVAQAIFNEDVEFISDMEFATEDEFSGIYDVTDERNPFKDWYHVFVPYCTGDVHWGDAVVEYGSGDVSFEINHKGAVNSMAVMDWIYDSFEAPEQFFVTGCSAGAYGSLLWATYLINHYPEAVVHQMGDSGVGIITDDFFNESFPNWNAESHMPEWIPELDPNEVDFLDLELHDVYSRAANYYEEYTYSQYTTAFDDNQHFYYDAMGGGDVFEWSERMYTSIDNAASQADNFRYFIAPGVQHCIIPYENFYTMSSNGVLLVDWIQDMIDGEDVSSIDCVDCEPPE